MDKIKNITELIDNGKAQEAEKLLDEIFKADNIDELTEIVYLYQRIGKYGKAINVCNRVLEQDPDNKTVAKQKEFLTEILKFTQLDIYASTNLHNDPWFE